MKNKGFKTLVISTALMFLTSGAAYAKDTMANSFSSGKGLELCKTDKSGPWGNGNNKQNNKVKVEVKDKAKVKGNAGYTKKKPLPQPKQIRVSKVTLNAEKLDLKVGQWKRLTATVTPQNAAIKKVLWVSDNPRIARVNPSGKITGLRPGTARIYVLTLDGLKKDSCLVTVKTRSNDDENLSEISLNKTSTTLTVGSSERLKVTAEDGTTPEIRAWYSLHPNIASVDQTGLVKARHTGTTVVFVVTKNGYASYCRVTVKAPASDDSDGSVSSISINHTTPVVALKEGTSKKLTVTVEPEDSDVTVTWKSSDTDVATVDRYGRVTGIDEGTARITAETSDGEYRDSVEVKVIPSRDWESVTGVRLNMSKVTLPVGFADTLKYTISPSDASDREVTWTSSRTSVATVDSWGKIEAKRAGTTTITATSADGRKVASCVVTVTSSVDEPDYGILFNKISSTLYEGEKDYPQVYLFPGETKTTSLTWESSDTEVATVSSSGVVTAVDTGTAVITATTSDGRTASYVVKVVDR